MKRLPCPFVFLVILLYGCETAADGVPDAKAAPPSNYLSEKSHSIDGRLYIGPQPNLTDLQNLKAEGIRHVVNFRTPGEMAKLDFREDQRLADLGIDYFEVPVGGREYPYSPAQLDALANILKQDGKVLLHCRSGQRASVITVAYLIEKEGMPINEALRHAEGWWPLELEDVLGQDLSLIRTSKVK